MRWFQSVQLVRELEGHSVGKVVLEVDDNNLYTAGADGVVCTWDIRVSDYVCRTFPAFPFLVPAFVVLRLSTAVCHLNLNALLIASCVSFFLFDPPFAAHLLAHSGRPTSAQSELRCTPGRPPAYAWSMATYTRALSTDPSSFSPGG